MHLGKSSGLQLYIRRLRIGICFAMAHLRHAQEGKSERNRAVNKERPITRRATRRVAALRRAAVRTLPAAASAASAARVLPAVARAARAVGKTALRAADRTTTIRRVTTSTRGTTRAASLPVSSVFGPTRRESPLFEKRIARFSFLFVF